MFKMKKIYLIAALIMTVSPLKAQEAKLGTTYDDWSTFYYEDKQDGKVCYIAAAPEKSEGSKEPRGNAFAVVTHRSKAKVFDVFNLNAGFKYFQDSEVALDISGQKFTLFTDKSSAWANDGDDSKIITAIAKAGKMTVKSKNVKGAEISDTFSLKGFSKAYNEISKQCGKN